MSVPIDQPDNQNPQAGMAVYAPVANNVLVPAGNSIGPFDMSAYDTVTVFSTTPITGGHRLDVIDPDTSNTIAVCSSPPDALGNVPSPIVIPMRSKRLTVNNNGPVQVAVSLFASSRHSEHAQRQTEWTEIDPLSFNLAGQAGAQLLGYGSGHGPAFTAFEVGANVVKGVFQVVTKLATMNVMDTVAMHVDPGGNQWAYQNWIAPRVTWLMQFVPSVTGNAGLRAFTVYDD